MSKLHMYQVVNGTRIPAFAADGDGVVNSVGFDVSITKGSVKKGVTYQIRQGSSSVGDSYSCTTGAGKGGMPTS